MTKMSAIYQMDVPRHDMSNCYAIKHNIQDLIDNGTIAVVPLSVQNINANPLPSHAPGP